MTRPLAPALALAAFAACATALAPVAVHGQAPGTVERIEFVANVLTISDVAVRPDGGELLAIDTAQGRLVRIDPATGAQTTQAAGLNAPRGVAPQPDGAALVAETGANRIVRVSATGTVTQVLGPLANAAQARPPLNAPGGVAVAADGAVLVADTGNHRIRRISPQGEVTDVAGTGTPGFAGDGGPATQAQLSSPARVAALPGGGFLVADTGNDRIRRVDVDGRISTIAGQLADPEGVAITPTGAVLTADTGLNLVRKLGTDGTLRTVAGTGTAGFNGEGIDAGTALLDHPRAVAADGTRILVADTGNGRLRAIVPVAAPDPTPDPPPIDDPTPEPPPGVAPPVIGERAVASTVRGTVRVRLPGRRRFAELDAASNLPLGTELDATRGEAAVFFATSPGTTALALASQGRFVLRQPDRLDRGERPGVLRLSQPLSGCTAPKARAGALLAQAAAKKRRGERRLRVRAKGRIKTTGRYGSAIVRGTAWTIVDRCRAPRAGTLVVVTEGLVAVRDFARRRTVAVAAGERYLAKAPRGRR